MSKIVPKLIDDLKSMIDLAISNAINAGELPKISEKVDFNVEIPADHQNGDFASNVAMVNAKKLKMPPIEIANAICKNLKLNNKMIDQFKIAGPGFINFFLSKLSPV